MEAFCQTITLIDLLCAAILELHNVSIFTAKDRSHSHCSILSIYTCCKKETFLRQDIWEVILCKGITHISQDFLSLHGSTRPLLSFLLTAKHRHLEVLSCQTEKNHFHCFNTSLAKTTLTLADRSSFKNWLASTLWVSQVKEYHSSAR